MKQPPIPLADLRTEYKRAVLDERDVERDPVDQFRRWFGEAVAAQMPEPSAMALATVHAAGRPSTRLVLLKDDDAGCFTFYTTYDTRKGRELAARPNAALLFFWPELERQIRIEGAVTKAAPANADAYFASRPRLSRLGAWASAQSEILADRGALEAQFAAMAARFPGEDVPRPPHWGGYRLAPDAFEFWQGRTSRLHDRIAYRREDGGWRIARLAP
jgi:pyridoxamine 5'-phosphate oxidase